MKKILFALSTIVLLSACGNDNAENLTIKGNIKGLKKGVLYLQHVPDTTLITIDSLTINGTGNFAFNTHLESPELLYLYLDKKDNNNYNDRISIFAEPGTITVQTEWNTFDTDAKISGSKTHAILEDYQKAMSGVNKRNIENLLNASKAKQAENQITFDSLENISNRNTQRGYAHAINFALNHKDSYIAPYIAVKDVADANRKYLDSIYGVLTPEVANSKYGLELKSLLE